MSSGSNSGAKTVAPVVIGIGAIPLIPSVKSWLESIGEYVHADPSNKDRAIIKVVTTTGGLILPTDGDAAARQFDKASNAISQHNKDNEDALNENWASDYNPSDQDNSDDTDDRTWCYPPPTGCVSKQEKLKEIR